LAIAIRKKIPLVVCLTKIDKLGRSESLDLFRGWLNTSGLEKSVFFPVSAAKNDGVRELEDYIFNEWIKPLKRGPVKIVG